MMRVVFLGTPDFAVPSLRALIDSEFEVAAVFTQPDRAAGRGQRPHQSPVKVSAAGSGVPVFQPEKIRSEENRSVLAQLAPDFIVVVAYGQILPGWLLQVARIATINVHGSLLPKYRGAAPIAWAILNGESVSGVTTMIVQEKLDSGPMLLKQEVSIPETMTAGELALELSQIGARLLLETLRGLVSGTLQPITQDESQTTWAPRISKAMAQIVWSRPAREIHNQVRAFNPWPLAYTESAAGRLQVLRTFPHDSDNVQPAGTLLSYSRSGMYVQCGQGAIEILEVKPASRDRMSGREFGNGARLHPGMLIS